MTYANLQAVPFGVEQVAVAVTNSAFGGGHIGLGFHSAKAGPQVLHLAWHLKLESHCIPGELNPPCWTAKALQVPPSASKQMVALIRAIAVKGPKINYDTNLLAAKGSFSGNGAYKPPKGSHGLTCATFVLEVLRAGMINLVKVETWPVTVENEKWANDVCEQLARTASPEHVASVRKNISSLRLRPFEVAGAAEFPAKAWPVAFKEAQDAAQTVVSQLQANCPPLGYT